MDILTNIVITALSYSLPLWIAANTKTEESARAYKTYSIASGVAVGLIWSFVSTSLGSVVSPTPAVFWTVLFYFIGKKIIFKNVTYPAICKREGWDNAETTEEIKDKAEK